MDLNFKHLAFELLVSKITKFPPTTKWADNLAGDLGAEMQEAGLVSSLRTKDGVKGARLLVQGTTPDDLHAFIEQWLRRHGYTD
jgi:hypothetical protein